MVVLKDITKKWEWLVSGLETYLGDGKILVFVGSRADTEDLKCKLENHFLARRLLVKVESIHGDR